MPTTCLCPTQALLLSRNSTGIGTSPNTLNNNSSSICKRVATNSNRWPPLLKSHKGGRNSRERKLGEIDSRDLLKKASTVEEEQSCHSLLPKTVNLDPITRPGAKMRTHLQLTVQPMSQYRRNLKLCSLTYTSLSLNKQRMGRVRNCLRTW